jgi:hypothetical protein
MSRVRVINISTCVACKRAVKKIGSAHKAKPLEITEICSTLQKYETRIRSSFAKKLPVKQVHIKVRPIRLTVCVEKMHLLKILKTDKLLGDLCQVIEFGIPGTIATNDVMRCLNRNSSVFDRLSEERERRGKGS